VRKQLPIIITFLMAMAAFIPNVFNVGKDLNVRSNIDNLFLAMEAVTLVLGIINLSQIHSSNIRRRRAGWIFSLILLVAMYGYLILGIFEGKNGTYFNWIYNNIMTPVDNTMYALLAFYIASAAFRAFRMRSLEATVMMVAGIIVMLTQAPIGATIWSYIPVVGRWIMNVPNTAAMRAVQLGAALGVYATLIRVLLGLERSYLGGSGE
jgi:hypothetical protein